MDGTGDLFDPFIHARGDQVKVQVVRYPNDIELGYDSLGDWVRKVLPVAEPYVILGESFSGPIAIALAAEHHPLLKGLVLSSIFARNPRPGLSGAGALLPFVPLGWMPSIALSHQLFRSMRHMANCRQRLARQQKSWWHLCVSFLSPTNGYAARTSLNRSGW